MTRLLASMLLGFLFQEGAPAPAPPIFEITAGGKAVELHDFPGGVFGQVEVARPTDIEVRARFDIRWVDIRPRSAGIVPVIAPGHGSLRFRLNGPVPLTIEFNGDWKRVIHLFGNPPEKDVPRPDTPGVRYFGPGVHEAGLIELKDGETLYLAEGAWVKGIVASVGTRNVSIRGRGVLDGSGIPRRQQPGRGAPAAAPPAAPPPAVSYGNRRNMIYLERSQNARVEGITLVNSQTWTFNARRSDGLRVDGIRILNGRGPCSTDGIDMVSSSDVLVENVFIRTNDDNVVVKNTEDVEVHDITVRKAVFWNEPCGNAIEVGFELRSAPIRKLRFEDIDIIRVERGSAISIHNGDSSTVEDVTFDNIRVEDARHKLIDFAIVYGQYGPDRPTDRAEIAARMDPGGAWDGVLRSTPEQKAALAKGRGRIRNVLVKNLQVLEYLPFSVLSGWDRDHAVENVTIQGMTYLGRPVRGEAAGKFSVDNAPGLKFR
jgi:hypothetical protein